MNRCRNCGCELSPKVLAIHEPQCSFKKVIEPKKVKVKDEEKTEKISKRDISDVIDIIDKKPIVKEVKEVKKYAKKKKVQKNKE